MVVGGAGWWGRSVASWSVGWRVACFLAWLVGGLLRSLHLGGVVLLLASRGSWLWFGGLLVGAICERSVGTNGARGKVNCSADPDAAGSWGGWAGGE